MASTEEKAALYDEVMAIVEDSIVLEKASRAGGCSFATVEGIRANSYGVIVNLLCGHFVLPYLPVAKTYNYERSGE